MNKDMNFYEELVNGLQLENYERNYAAYQSGGTAVPLTDKAHLPYGEQIKDIAKKVEEAECVVIGGASGLSAAGGGDFYYEDNASFRKYFGKFADKYHLNGAFSGTFRRWESREEFWAYMATFLHTTVHAPVRRPYVDLDAIVRDKDFFVVTTNQDTQFLRLYPESKVAEIQGDHRFFQCSRPCSDNVWNSEKEIEEMIEAMGDGTAIPTELIPRCPRCGAEAFPWVRGYGNFLTGKKYQEEYQKVSDYILSHKDRKILFVELGIGRLTPMFIQEPFWYLTEKLPQARYVSVNLEYAFLPKAIEDRGIAVKGDIAKVLADVRAEMKK